MQLCNGAGVSLPACFALSSGQETPTVSAVSLTANEFPGGGVVVLVYECVSDECLDMRGGNRCMGEGSGGTQKEKTATPGCSGNLHTPGFGTTQQEELLSQQLRLFLPALLCQAGLSPPCFSLKPHGGLQTEAGVTQMKCTEYCNALQFSDANLFFKEHSWFVCWWKLFNSLSPPGVMV